MAIPLATVILGGVLELLGGYSRHQQAMAQLENDYLLECERIKQDTQLKCQQLDAALQYGLAQLEQQRYALQQQFAVQFKHMDLCLQESKQLKQHINAAMMLACDANTANDIRMAALTTLLPTLMAAQTQQNQHRHQFVLEALNKPLALSAPNLTPLVAHKT